MPPSEGEEFLLPLTPQDLWPAGLHYEWREQRAYPCQADETIQPQLRCNYQTLSRPATRGDTRNV